MHYVAELGGWAAGGAVSGAAGARVLARAPRGVVIPPSWCGVGVAALWAVTGMAAPPAWWVPVPLALGWCAVLLSATDVAARRLPDAVTLPAYPVTGALLAVAAVGTVEPMLLVRGAVGMLGWSGCYALVRLVAPAALGAGDLKLAGPLGAVTAATAWTGLLAAMLGAAVVTVALALPARLLGYREVAHGPAMLAAAWLVVL